MTRPRQDWYPGLMERTRRFLAEHLPRIDLVLEITDARAPQTARWHGLDGLIGETRRLLVLNKADLADRDSTALWLDHFSASGTAACAAALAPGSRPSRAKDVFSGRNLRSAVERLSASGRPPTGRATKVAVVGIPNVGKSSVLNAIAGRRRAPTGAKPGLTRGQQWAVASPRLWLLDLPGVLPPAPRDDDELARLALVGALPEGSFDDREAVLFLLRVLKARFGFAGALDALDLDPEAAGPGDPPGLLVAFACRRGLLAGGGEVDAGRGAQALLALFRRGGLGRISLEEVPAGAKV